MEPIAKSLNDAGMTTINLAYASFRHDLKSLAEMVRDEIVEHLESGAKVHFVTHSLGGIVLRELLNEGLNFNMGKVVMLAPPNQGSEIVDWLSDSPLKWLLGPAGTFLSTNEIGRVNQKFPDPNEVLVVMGSKSKIPFFRSMLDADNDGIVSVNKGKMDDDHGFHVVDSDHTTITFSTEVIELVNDFFCAAEA